MKATRRRYYLKHMEKKKRQAREQYLRLTEEQKIRYRSYDPILFRTKARMARIDSIEHYSQGKNVCSCCGEHRLEFLSIDHINGGGQQHRKLYRPKYASIGLYLVANNYPEGFRVLCYNCNLARGFNKYCPHEREKGEWGKHHSLEGENLDTHRVEAHKGRNLEHWELDMGELVSAVRTRLLTRTYQALSALSYSQQRCWVSNLSLEPRKSKRFGLRERRRTQWGCIDLTIVRISRETYKLDFGTHGLEVAPPHLHTLYGVFGKKLLS